MTATIPKAKIKKTSIYVNRNRLPLDEVVRETGAQYIINGGLFNMATFAPASGLTADAQVLFKADAYGYALGGAPVYSYANNQNARDWIGAYPSLLRDGKKDFSAAPAGLDGERARSAIGLTENGDFVMRCFAGGVSLNSLAQLMFDSGCVNAINLDGGGSTQGYFNGEWVRADRIVHNYVCVWTTDGDGGKTGSGEVDEITATALCAMEVYDKSGLAERGRYISGGDVCRLSRTIEDGMLIRVTYPTSSGERTAYVKSLANFRSGEPPDVKITTELIPKGKRNRPGGKNSCKYVTIHNTDNEAETAGARNHAVYLKNADIKEAWHYTVDEDGAYRHIPDGERANHTGTNKGNRESIGIEICENGDIRKATDNAAKLAALLLIRHGLTVDELRQHYDWNRKNCPARIRAGEPYDWQTFKAKVQEAITNGK